MKPAIRVAPARRKCCPCETPWRAAAGSRWACSCVAALAASCGRSGKHERAEDARFAAIYNTEWKWRTDQQPDDEDGTRPISDHLPRVDPATQEMRLKYWEDVQQRLAGDPTARSSRPPSRSTTTSTAPRSRCWSPTSASATSRCRPTPTPPSGRTSATPRGARSARSRTTGTGSRRCRTSRATSTSRWTRCAPG